MTMKAKIDIYSDGGARGNPGPAAIAFIILSEDSNILASNSRYIGIRTNNQAEYEALNSALEVAKEIGKKVTCYMDSELVKKQLTGEYKVRNQELFKLYKKTLELEKNFEEINFINIPRENYFIRKVDKLLNKILDGKLANKR